MAAVHGDIWSIPGFSEPVSSMTHLLGAGVAAVGIPRLMRKASGTLQRAGVAVFAMAAVLLLSMSGVFHLLDPLGTPREVFLRFDHAAIWLLIAGTLTPMLLSAFKGRERITGLVIVWTCAVTGITLKTIFFHSIPEALGLGLYLLMGWICAGYGILLARRRGSAVLRGLVTGGIIYSVGAAIDFACVPTIIPHVFGPHEIFHLAVLGGVTAHARFTGELFDLLNSKSTETTLPAAQSAYA